MSFLMALNVTNFYWTEVPIFGLKTTEGKIPAASEP